MVSLGHYQYIKYNTNCYKNRIDNMEVSKIEKCQGKNIPDTLNLAVCSDIRRNILLCLKEGKKSLAALRSSLQKISSSATISAKVSSSTIIHGLRELEKSDLVFEDKDRNYLLTNIGRMITMKLLDFTSAVDVLRKQKRFWSEHDLSGIPDHLLEKIGLLKDSEIIHIDVLDIVKTHSSYISFIKKAKWIKGVSPIYSPDYTTVFKELIEKNINTNLILSESVYNKSTQIIGLENLKNAISTYGLEISVIHEKLSVAFTVTESFFSLGLFNNNGVYDNTQDLVSTDENAIRWGIELFEYYREKGVQVKF
jgi:predicted transcriptional regulator